MPAKNVICFGEVLWDCLPNGRFPGGAPLNVAYHLEQLGVSAWLLSAVGADARGAELVAEIDARGVRSELVARLPDSATGQVQVTVDKGIPSYTIEDRVAWDRIAIPDGLPADIESVDAIVFGSLAQRYEGNLEQLIELLERYPSALKVFDVNIREPHVNVAAISELASRATLIKLSDEETAYLLGKRSRKSSLDTAARQVAEATGTRTVCLTAGAQGAGLLADDTWSWVDAIPVEVKDTVGAGDSFLASLVAGMLLRPDETRENLAKAATLAAFVASRDGPTPKYRVAPDGRILE